MSTAGDASAVGIVLDQSVAGLGCQVCKKHEWLTVLLSVCSCCVHSCSWDLSQPPRDNSPAMKLYRHSQTITGLAQITDERLVSGSMDGSVSLLLPCNCPAEVAVALIYTRPTNMHVPSM